MFAGQRHRASLGQLAPVADDPESELVGRVPHPVEILDRPEVRSAEIVDRADSEFGAPSQRHPGRLAPLGVGEEAVQRAPAEVMRLPADQTVVAIAGRRPDLGKPVEQRGRDDRRVHVDPGEVDGRTAAGPVQFRAGRRGGVRPTAFVPALPEQDAGAGRAAAWRANRSSRWSRLRMPCRSRPDIT